LILLLACWLLSLGCSVHPSSGSVVPLSHVGRAGHGGTIMSADQLADYTGCTEIHGSLTISSPTLRHVSSLSSVQVVTGDLIIKNNPLLGDLKGLGALVKVRDVLIISNRKLPNLDGLNQLRVARTLEIYGNRSLNSTLGLGALTSLSALVVHGSQLSTVYSLPVVELDALIVTDNGRLHSLRGLTQLRKVGYLELRNNPLLFGGQANLLPHLVSTQALVEMGNLSFSQAEAERLRDKNLSLPQRSTTLLSLQNHSESPRR